MAQRLRSCSKTTNFDTINCRTYLNSLAKDAVQPYKQRCAQKCFCSRDRSLSNSKKSLMITPTTPPNLKSKAGSIQQHNLLSPRTQSAPANILHRELIGDNSALVEVTVRTKANRKSHKLTETKNKRQPWSDLLKSSRYNEVLFGRFDPLRTLHFLGQELNSVLKLNTPGECAISKIVAQMLEALNRIPPEVVASIGNQQNNIKRPKDDIKDSGDVPERLHNMLRNPRFEHKMCQTIIDDALFVKTETVHQQLETTIKDLDKKCKEMEKFCKNLKMEKLQLEHLLNSEKDMVSFLRKQLEDLQTERVSSESAMVSQLTKESNILNTQLKSLQLQIDSQILSMNELKNQAEDAQKQKQAFEQENLSIRHSLTISKLEKEKYLTILSVRDRQVKEILNEMNQLQDVVNEELVEFQKNPLTSQSSTSRTTVTSNWRQLQNLAKANCRNEMGDNANVLFPNSNILINQLLLSQDTESFFELPSLDSTTSNLALIDSNSSKLQDPTIPSKLYI